MAKITLDNLRHSYFAQSQSRRRFDFRFERTEHDWVDARPMRFWGRVGLRNPALLNIILGLLAPSRGAFCSNDRDCDQTIPRPQSATSPQVFSFRGL